MAVTIKDIARESGYSVSTVSRALNNHPDVSPEAKAQIKKIVEDYAFSPNKNARRLKQSASKSITILVKGRFNMLFASLVEQMQGVIQRAGYTAHIHYMDEAENEVLLAVRFCAERKPMGIVFLGGNYNNFKNGFKQIKVPCVLVTNDASTMGFPNLSSVTIDDMAASAAAVAYLIDCGHRRIGIIGGIREEGNLSQLRYLGAVEAIEAEGLSFDDEQQYGQAWYSYESAYEAMLKLLGQGQGLTAVFAMSDVMAIGAIRAIRDRGLVCPENISVCGFDGIEIGRYYNPKLTTMIQAQEVLSRRGVEILLDCIERNGGAVHELVECLLSEGESVARVKQ